MNPKIAIYPNGTRSKAIVSVISVASAILIALTIVIALGALVMRCDRSQAILASLAAFWAVCPPFWFFYEYFWLYRGEGAEDTFELFKHGQQMAVAIWAGLSVTLGALATSDFAKPKSPAWICVPATVQVGAAGWMTCRLDSADNITQLR